MALDIRLDAGEELAQENVTPRARRLAVAEQIEFTCSTPFGIRDGVTHYKPGVEDGDRHIGPYAEDMKRNFGMGDGKSVNLMDELGITMAALKGLADKVDRLERAGFGVKG